MRVGNVFIHVCLSVCISICVSVFLSVQAITFESLDIETSFLMKFFDEVCRYILTISRSGLSIKVIRSRSRSYEKKMIVLCHGMTKLVKVLRKDQSVNKNSYFYYFGQFRVFL